MLNQQVAREFAASQQYVAIAVHFDGETLPALAAHFYRQALEDRNHAMMIVQYLLDSDAETVIPGVEAPQTTFSGAEEAVSLALAQERQVTEQIVELARLARDEGELVGEQFLHWFLAEQREEVASMSALLSVVRRAGPNLLAVEDFLSRGGVGGEEQAAVEAAAPPAAGGSLGQRLVDAIRDGLHRQRLARDVLQQLLAGRLLAERPELAQ
jgi:ferritin